MKQTLFSWNSFRRPLFILFILGSFSFILLHVYHVSAQYKNAQIKTDQKLTHLLISQAAIYTQKLFVKNDLKAMNELTLEISQNPLINSMSIYDNQGNLLASNSEHKVKEELALQAPLQTLQKNNHQLVHAIVSKKNKQIGFVRMSFNQAQLNFISETQSKTYLVQILFCIFVSFLLGILVIYYGYIRVKYKKVENILLTKKNLPAQHDS